MRTILLTLLSFLLAAPAFASEIQLTGSGGSVWYNQKTVRVASSTVTLFMTVSDTSSIAALFAADQADDNTNALRPGTSVAPKRLAPVIAADAKGICCWQYDLQVSTSTRGFVTDAGGSNGPGNCFGVGPTEGAIRNQKPNRMDHVALGTPGSRAGLCPNAVTIMNGSEMFAPCDATADADCTNYGGGTCVTSPTLYQRNRAGAFLECIPKTGAMGVEAHIDAIRIQK